VLEAGLYRSMSRCAEQVVVVTDSSKIGADQLQAILSFDDIDVFITDASAPAEFVQLLRERGIEVVVVPVGRG